jgi:hypothetical protein
MNRRVFLQYSASLLAISKAWANARELWCDVAVIGGGVGGFAGDLNGGDALDWGTANRPGGSA